MGGARALHPAGEHELRRAASDTVLRMPRSSPRSSFSLTKVASPKRHDSATSMAFQSARRLHFGALRAEREVPESPSAQALAAMVERLHDEELRKREERKAVRTLEREQEIAQQAPFMPKTSANRANRPSEPERHLLLYDHRLEMAERRRQQQEQRLRDEQEYLEAHSVHRTKPAQVDPAVYQRLHEHAELKQQRRNEIEERERAEAPSPARRVASERQLKLYELATEVAQKRRAMYQEKLRQEQHYLEKHSVHRACSPQADPALVSQRLYESKLKKMRKLELQREQERETPKAEAERKKMPTRKDEEAMVQRLFRPERRQRQRLREEEEEWLQQRRRASLPQRATSCQGRFPFPQAPAESPKAMSEATPDAKHTARSNGELQVPASAPTVAPFLQTLPGDLPLDLEDAQRQKLNEMFDAFMESKADLQPAVNWVADAPANAEQESDPAQPDTQDRFGEAERRRLSLELEECF